jgi:hypothetical protein
VEKPYQGDSQHNSNPTSLLAVGMEKNILRFPMTAPIFLSPRISSLLPANLDK